MDASKATHVATVVVTYNGMAWIEACLRSLLSSCHPTRIIVVDNASSDDTVHFITDHFPGLTLLRSSHNLGFGQANNLGIRLAMDQGARFVFLLNQDARVEADTIGLLVETLESHAGCGIVSPLQFDGKGKDLDLYFRRYLDQSGVFLPDPMTPETRPPDTRVMATRYVNAAAWMITLDCLRQTGGFDPIFFHYGEDVNYARRVIHAGYTILVDGQAAVFHDREDRISRQSGQVAFDLKREWDHFLNQACDPSRNGFVFFGIRRSLRHLWEAFRAAVGGRFDEASVQRRLSLRILGGLRQIGEARKRIRQKAFTLPGPYTVEPVSTVTHFST
jgi:GT2 family glycosyltransferase